MKLDSRLNEINDQSVLNSKLLNLIKSTLEDASEYELSLFSNLNNLLSREAPSTKLMITQDIQSLIIAKKDLAYLILKVREVRRSYYTPYSKLYNKYYRLGTKKGLPSRAAIEADMYLSSDEINDYKSKLDDIDMLLDFLQSYNQLVDSSIRNLESRRYDV